MITHVERINKCILVKALEQKLDRYSEMQICVAKEEILYTAFIA